MGLIVRYLYNFSGQLARTQCPKIVDLFRTPLRANPIIANHEVAQESPSDWPWVRVPRRARQWWEDRCGAARRLSPAFCNG